MSSPHSNLLLQASALSWTIVRYDTLPMYNIHNTHRFPQKTRANRQAAESLAPRIKALSTSLCKPIPEGDIREAMRRNELEQ